jgi:mycofactocin precursor
MDETTTTHVSITGPAGRASALLADELLVEELLVEEISIDGMCGVY